MKYFSLFAVILLFSYIVKGQTVGLIQHENNSLDDGYVLFAPNTSTTTYLIDKCGKKVKSWQSAYKPGQSVYLLSDGTLLRTGNTNNTTFKVGGSGGIVEKIDWDGNVVWSYIVSDATKCQHHDVKAMPNGNVLIIAWESKTKTEAIAAGLNPSLAPTTVWSEYIIEVQPKGINGGTIVWEWHLWDHLVQDYDNNKPNFGAIASNHQLININYKSTTTNEDWIHLNSIDYNPVLDQIVLSSHNFNEIWIIDHSTSTAEAASHTGGNSGAGGDLLYRWGNPAAYDKGTSATQKLYGQHNAYWIPTGYPFEDQIMIFNNGVRRPDGNYSTVEIINPPVNGYTYDISLPFLPSSTSWNYNYGDPNGLYSQNISGAQQLPNGNVLICIGGSGRFIETTTSGMQVWEYINPVKNTGVISQGTTPSMNSVFRCTYYPSSYTGFASHTLIPGKTIENSNTISDSCHLVLGIESNSDSNKLKIYPNPAKEKINISFIDIESKNVSVQIFNTIGEIVYVTDEEVKGVLVIDIQSFETGMYVVKVDSERGSFSERFIKK